MNADQDEKTDCVYTWERKCRSETQGLDTDTISMLLCAVCPVCFLSNNQHVGQDISVLVCDFSTMMYKVLYPWTLESSSPLLWTG